MELGYAGDCSCGTWATLEQPHDHKSIVPLQQYYVLKRLVVHCMCADNAATNLNFTHLSIQLTKMSTVHMDKKFADSSSGPQRHFHVQPTTELPFPAAYGINMYTMQNFQQQLSNYTEKSLVKLLHTNKN
jgi:hypothetical protein